ncbi:T-complex protein 1 subunit zeta, partial [Tanacetum coccineum]
MSLRVLNPNAEVLNKSAALNMNINAAKGLQDVLKSNLGSKGTIKMLVGGAGDIKLTKDGNTLLKEMGAGALEVAARQYLVNDVKKTVKGRAQLGVQAFADALLIVPKTLAENSGLDTQDVIISLT